MTSQSVDNGIGISFSVKLKTALEEIVQEARSCKSVNNANDEACSNLEEMIRNSTTSIPLKAISIAKSVAIATSDQSSLSLLKKLNESLKRTTDQTQTQLVFPTKAAKGKHSEAYEKRIKRLRLAEQERNYSNLTQNLDSAPADDATLKSMTYAASIGANMIVAPISIGVLMYFFAGKLFAFIVPGYQVEEGKINIHGVIVGVISGVVMLFIEMILFVIRNHEMDRFITKKMKKHKNPFGYEKKAAERTYQGEQD